MNTLTSGNADLNSIQEQSNSDIGSHFREQFRLAEDLNFQLFRNVMFCVGFTKSLDTAVVDRKKNVLVHLWELLNVNSNEQIKDLE